MRAALIYLGIALTFGLAAVVLVIGAFHAVDFGAGLVLLLLVAPCAGGMIVCAELGEAALVRSDPGSGR